MKMPQITVCAIIPILALLLMAGCGSSRSSESGSDITDGSDTTNEPGGADDPGTIGGTDGLGDTDSGGIKTISSTIFFDAIQEVTPSFSPVGTPSLSPLMKAKSITVSWKSGNPVYELFYLFQEFNSDTDQGVIDTSNVHKTMWEADHFLAGTMSACTAIPKKTIASPFDFGNPPTDYQCAFNRDAEDGHDFGGALKILDANGDAVDIAGGKDVLGSAAALSGLFGFVWNDGSHSEYGVFQGEYDTSTTVLSGDIAVWVDYQGENDYCYRSDIDGYSDTHAFTLRAIKGNRAPDSSFISIVGKGYAKGEGKSFLVKMTGPDLAGKYYCIGAEASEAELQAMDAQGSAAVDAACAEYQGDVDAMVPLTTADLACESADFNPGGAGTAAEGTIFLNYQK